MGVGMYPSLMESFSFPTPSTSSEPIMMDVPFPTTMIAYQDNLKFVAEPSPSCSQTEEEDPYV